jgi:hypothetical protein
LKNNGYIDIDHINTTINTLKVQINVLLNEVLGVEHEIDNIHEYDDTSIQARIGQNEQDIDYMIQLLYDHGGEIAILLGKLNGIKSLTSSLSLFNENHLKMSVLDNGYNQTTIDLTPNDTNLQVASGSDNTLYRNITLGGGTTESGVSILSDNSINISQRDLSHYIEITKDKTYISDVNGFVFEPSPAPKPAGVRIKSFDNEHYLDIPWAESTGGSDGENGEVEPYVAGSVADMPTSEEPPSSVAPAE